MTMSSRLRTTDGRHGTLQDIEDTINSTGRRKIAKFEMSLADPDSLSEKKDDALAKSEKAGSASLRSKSDGDIQMNDFDIDAFSKDYRLTSIKNTRKEYIFARAETHRGAWQVYDAGRRPRDRFGVGPAVER